MKINTLERGPLGPFFFELWELGVRANSTHRYRSRDQNLRLENKHMGRRISAPFFYLGRGVCDENATQL